MFEVYPVQDKEEQKRLCEKCSVTYDVDKLAYKGIVNGEFVGILQFGIKNKSGYIYDAENVNGTDDPEILFVMGRAALNFMDLCGITDNYFVARAEGREALVQRIGFRNFDDKWYMNAEGFFTEPCKCEQ